MSSDLQIRIFQRGDDRAIAEIFTAAVHEIACEHYTPEQCLAWADRVVNYDRWRKRCELKRPFVAISEGRVAGFLELDSDGHIDCAYINPSFQRRGIMTRLVQHAIDTCHAMNIHRLYVEASYCAQPMFQKLGFQTLHQNIVERQGVQLVNFTMEHVSLPASQAVVEPPVGAAARRLG